MELKLGANIAAFRKSRGMTQEQLAAALGVSAPAVSKWETDRACPDITLLCPLARALGTNVDTLMEFEETLSEEQLTENIVNIVEVARTQGVPEAETMLQKLLYRYPSCISLKYNAAEVLTAFEIMFPSPSEESRRGWKEQKKELLRFVSKDRTSVYWQAAISQLASIAIAEDELEKAERLLKELPEHIMPEYGTDFIMPWVQLYLKRGEGTKALEMVQKRLYVLVVQVQECLTHMMSEKMEPDARKSLEICKIYRKTEELFGCGGMSDGLFAEVYMYAGQKQKAMDSLIHLVNTVVGEAKRPKPLLFSLAVKQGTEQEAPPREVRQMLLQGMLTDESIAEFRENEDFMAAIERLRGSI